jgi:hypothetical protein
VAADVRDDGKRNLRRLKSGARQDRLAELLARSPPPAAGSPAAKELAGLLARGDPYDARLFDAPHVTFKADHNAVLVALLRWCREGEGESEGDGGKPSGNVFYLDGADGATTAALRAAGVRTGSLYVANPHAATRAALTSPPAALAPPRVAAARAEDALCTNADGRKNAHT